MIWLSSTPDLEMFYPANKWLGPKALYQIDSQVRSDILNSVQAHNHSRPTHHLPEPKTDFPTKFCNTIL